jgi:hypothetical protein
MKRGDFRKLATNWNYSGFASQIGPVPAPSTTRNAPGIERSAGPNIFADPAPGSTIRAGDAGQRNGVRGDGFFTVDISPTKRFVMPYKESHSL